TDACRAPALHESEDCGEEGERGEGDGEPDDDAAAAGDDAAVDDGAVDERGGGTGHGVDHHEAEEERDEASVRAGERTDAPERSGSEAVVGDGLVEGEGLQGSRHRETPLRPVDRAKFWGTCLQVCEYLVR